MIIIIIKILRLTANYFEVDCIKRSSDGFEVVPDTKFPVYMSDEVAQWYYVQRVGVVAVGSQVFSSFITLLKVNATGLY